MSVTQNGFTAAVYNSNWAEISSAQLGETIYITLAAPAILRSWICEISDIYDDRFLPDSEDADTHDVTFTWTIPTDIIRDSMSREYTIDIYATTEYSMTRFYIPLTINVPEYTLAPPIISVKSSLQRDGESLYYDDISYTIVNFVWPQDQYGSNILQDIRYYDVLSGYNLRLEDEVIVDGHTIEATIKNDSGHGEKVVVATATDNRGKTSQATATFNVEFYNPIKVSEFNAFRCTTNGVEDEENGTCLFYNISFVIIGGNDLVEQGVAITLNWKKTSDTSYSSVNIPWQAGGSLNLTGIIDEFSFSPEHNYYVYAQVTDSFTTATSAVQIIPSYGVLLDFRADGNGFSIGKIATSQTDPLFEVAWPAKFYDTAIFQKGDAWIGPCCIRNVDGTSYRAEMGVGTQKSAAIEFATVDGEIHNRMDLCEDRTELWKPLTVGGGGTGLQSLTTGYFLRGNGTDEVTLTSPDDTRVAIGADFYQFGIGQILSPYVSNANEVYHSGFYRINEDTTNGVNRNAVLMHKAFDGNFAVQEAILYNKSTHRRLKVEGVWEAWYDTTVLRASIVDSAIQGCQIKTTDMNGVGICTNPGSYLLFAECYGAYYFASVRKRSGLVPNVTQISANGITIAAMNTYGTIAFNHPSSSNIAGMSVMSIWFGNIE